MAESFFGLSAKDRADVLGVAASRAGRPAELLEKEIWVVWTLAALFEASFAHALTFKGGTSLSKVYGVIDRFSEDVDLTYDIRALLPEFEDEDGDPIPSSRSQADRITREVRTALPDWVGSEPHDALIHAVGRKGLDGVEVRVERTNLIVAYPSTELPALDYVRTEVLVEFGARSSGEPASVRGIACDAAPYVEGVDFPTARPRVMAADRTFWEKATAVHVYCLQERLRSERFARHWYDLAQFQRVGLADEALRNRDVASRVAEHKARFFREKSAEGRVISYADAVEGHLVLVPRGEAREGLADDYERMASSGLLPANAPTFDAVMEVCEELQRRANHR